MAFEGESRTMATDPPTRALLHKLVTTGQGPFGSFYSCPASRASCSPRQAAAAVGMVVF